METLKMSFVAIAFIGTILCNLKNAGAQEFVDQRSGHGWDDFAMETAQTVLCENDQEKYGRECVLAAPVSGNYRFDDEARTVNFTVSVPLGKYTYENIRSIQRTIRAAFRAYAPEYRRYRIGVEVRVHGTPLATR